MSVIVAPDKFKGSLTAAEAAAGVAAGIRAQTPGVQVVCAPVADGGDGTLDAVLSAGFRRVPVTAEGPTGAPVRTAYARRGGVAVVELADASGLSRLPDGRPAPRTASSHGTGQLIRAALEAGCRQVVLGIGGSACTDGGAGLLQALGARLLDRSGAEPARGGAALRTVDAVDLTGLHPGLAEAEIIVAGDVDNPLLGPSGASSVYGPQKGATPEDVRDLEAGLSRWAAVLDDSTGTDLRSAPGAGAAGGVGFAAMAALGARMRSGIDVVLELTRFAERMRGARLVITGEGSLDTQTLRGKAPAGVAASARAAAVPVVAVAGRSLLSARQSEGAGFDAVYTLADIEPDQNRCIAQAAALLETIGGRIACEWCAP